VPLKCLDASAQFVFTSNRGLNEVMIARTNIIPRTKRQKEILDFIVWYSGDRGHEPSYAQIAKHFKVKSKATIAKHIAALEKRGLISRRHEDGTFVLRIAGNEPEVSRFAAAVKVVEDLSPDALCQVPLMGRIAAGRPILNEAVDSDTIAVPRFLLGRVRPESVFALRVHGDSMIDEHICDGDIALIESRPDARDGEIVVALIDDHESTLKRIFRHGPEVELRPANASLESIRVSALQVTIQGVYRGLLRSAH
jgi:repressor LexA